MIRRALRPQCGFALLFLCFSHCDAADDSSESGREIALDGSTVLASAHASDTMSSEVSTDDFGVDDSGFDETVEQSLNSQALLVEDTRLRAKALAFFLEDKRAAEEGIFPMEELKDYSVYLEDPRCHAPDAHGDHVQ